MKYRHRNWKQVFGQTSGRKDASSEIIVCAFSKEQANGMLMTKGKEGDGNKRRNAARREASARK